MTISAVPLVAVDCVSRDSPLADAIEILRVNRVAHVPVCENGKFVGMVGASEILAELVPPAVRQLDDLGFAGDILPLLRGRLAALRERKVGEVVARDLPRLRPDSPLLEAVHMLVQQRISLPVVAADGSFHGLLSRQLLLDYLAGQAGA